MLQPKPARLEPPRTLQHRRMVARRKPLQALQHRQIAALLEPTPLKHMRCMAARCLQQHSCRRLVDRGVQGSDLLLLLMALLSNASRVVQVADSSAVAYQPACACSLPV